MYVNHHSGTDQTSITFTSDGKFRVVGTGGYDGCIRRDFDEIEDAMDYLATLWKLNSGRFETNKDIVGYDKPSLIKRMVRKSYEDS